MGIRTIKSLALLVTSAVLYTSGRKERLLVQEYQSCYRRFISRQVAQKVKKDIHPEDVYSGLVDQTGFLVLLDKDTERFALLAHDIFQNKTELDRAEQEKRYTATQPLTYRQNTPILGIARRSFRFP